MTPKPVQRHPVTELPDVLLDALVARVLWAGTTEWRDGRVWITDAGVTHSFSPTSCLADALLAGLRVPVLPQPADLRRAALEYLRTLHGDTYEYETQDYRIIFELL